ncbi:MAG: signal peptidase I [Sulfurimonas sp.]|jgi:signal peptidase I|nr:signal peptidase I [Sulfurimonadaceae bacterium]
MREFLLKLYRFSNSWTGTIVIVLFVIFFVAQAFRIPSGSMKDSLLIGDHLFAKKFAYGIPMPHLPFLEVSIMPWSDKLKLFDGAKPKRGDVVIFRPPHDIKNHFVKRCVALPNDELFLEDKNLYLHPHEGDEYIKQTYKDFEVVERYGKLWVKNPYKKDHPGIHNDEKFTRDSLLVADMNGHIKKTISSSEYQTYSKSPSTIIRPTIEIFPKMFDMEVVKVEDDHYYMMGDNRDHSNDSRYWGSVPYENIEGTPWIVYFSIDENYEIRWDRVGKTPDELEKKTHLDKAIAERILKDKDDHGLY